MADVTKVGNNTPLSNQNNAVEMPKTGDKNGQNNVNLPVVKPGEGEQIQNLPQPPSEKLFSDVVTGREGSQLGSAEQMRDAAGVSATDKLLGLHLQPTITGALVAPPGNSDALRNMTPTMRRTIMRNLLSKQRERTKKLALLVRHQRDRQDDGNGDDAQQQREDSFIGLLSDGSEDLEVSPEQVHHAADELVSMARMLDLLDEMLNLQDYTISQMGTFAQG
ncbi:MAG: hypothetical protein H7Z37_16875 [Pyrinomonadaceae bacterium]|nr:hypothetical protein [Pyrinomonadaceae bacterium]